MCIVSLDEKRDSCSKTLHCASDVQYKMGNVGTSKGGCPLIDSLPASEVIPILSIDSWYRSWNELWLVGHLGLCDLPVTSFPEQNSYIQILTNSIQVML